MRQLVISASSVLVGAAGHMLSPGAVLIDGERINAVGSPDSLNTLLRHDAVRLDYPGATVLPGLIDAHVHLAFAGPPDPLAALNTLDDAALLLTMAGHARQLLDAGVTTVRDLGDRGYLAVTLRDSIASGERLGPRVLTSGAPLTSPGGHCWFLGGEVEEPSQIRNTIARHAGHGVDWIKVMASGGNITPNSPPIWQSQFSDEQLRVVVAEATARGLPVAAHAHSTAATAAAALAGATSIEHCRWLTSATYDDPDLNDDTAAVIAEKGIIVTPTIGTNYQLNEQRRPGFVEHQTRVLRWQDNHGIRIMNGTDVGVSPFDLYSHHRYLEAYQRAGFPNARILDILTRESAAGLGLADQIGTLSHDYSADLIVVDGDPLTDLTALGRLLLVVTRGRRHTPGSYRAPSAKLR